MGCGLTKWMKVHEVSKVQDSTRNETHPHNNMPKISINPIETVNVDKKMPKGYIEPDSQITYTEANEEEMHQNDETRLQHKANKIIPRISSEIALSYEVFQRVDKKKTQSDYIFIIGCLKDHFLFCNLNTIELERVVKTMFYCQADPGTLILKQGDSGNCFFVLEKGVADVLVDEKVKKQVKSGQCFGDLALIYNAPRAATIRVVETCYLWGLDRKNFRRTVDEIGIKESAENRKVIETISFFETLTEMQKDAISTVMILQKFVPGENIVNEGDIAASFYIIKEGNVVIIKGDKEIRKLKKGDSFGELALYYQTVRDATVRAIDPVHCLALSRDALTNILGNKIQKITFRNIKKWAFDRSELLNKLTSLQKEKLMEAFELRPTNKGDSFFEINKPCPYLLILLEGALKKTNNPETIITQKSWLVGDEFLAKTSREKPVDFQVLVHNEGIVGILGFEKFFECIGGSLEEVFEKNQKSHEKAMFQAKKNLERSMIPINKLTCLYKIGSGHFGSVYLMKNNENNEFFALKCVLKAQIIEANLERILIQERKVLEIVTFPFIMSFIRSYKDANYIYFLLEYVHGVELYHVIRELGTLSFQTGQFYTGLLILMVEYLHSNSIIYRDFKPENLMVEKEGYLKMIDLGTAKQLKSFYGIYRTNTLIGSPHYMAPEVIAGKGYSFPVDLWSIGVIVYEFFCECLPFGNKSEDPFEIYQQIMKKKLSFPYKLKDQIVKAFIKQLLDRNPEGRLKGSFAALKTHEFFNEFDWDALFEKRMKSPYIPDEKKLHSLQTESKWTLQEELMKDSKALDFKKKKPSDALWDMIF